MHRCCDLFLVLSLGLKLKLFVDQFNYMSGKLSQTGGVRVTTHSPDSYAKIGQLGQNIRPGTSTSLAMQMTDAIRLPHPHPADCFDSWEQTDLNRGLMKAIKPRYDQAVMLFQHMLINR